MNLGIHASRILIVCLVVFSLAVGALMTASRADALLAYAVGKSTTSTVLSDPAGQISVTPADVRSVFGMAAYGDHLFWLQTPECSGEGLCSGASVAKYNMRAGVPPRKVVKDLTLISRSRDPLPGLAVSDRYVFWIENDERNNACAIARADFDGANVRHRYVTDVSCRGGLASYTSPNSRPSYTTLYYVGSRTGRDIMSYGSTGLGDSTKPVVELAEAAPNGVWGVAVNADHLFWMNHGLFSSSIGRVDRLGPRGRRPTAGQADFIKGASAWAQAMAADKDRVYWTNWSVFEPSIAAALTNGRVVNLNRVKTGGPTPTAVAVANPVEMGGTGGGAKATVTARGAQRIGKKHFGIRVRLRSGNVPFVAEFMGYVKIAGGAHPLALAPRKVRTKAEKTRTALLVMKKAGAKRRVLSATRAGRRVTARIQVKTTEAPGAVRREHLKVRLLPRHR